MNITVQVPGVGRTPRGPVEERRENMLHTRLAYGDDSGFLYVPGLLEVERVRYPGGEVPPRVQHDIPIDPALKQLVNVVQPSFWVVEGDDGSTYVERTIYSNDGRWQDKQPFWVTGKFDEAVSPPSGAPDRPPPDTVRRPFLTEALPQTAEMQRADQAANTAAATEAGAPRRGPGRPSNAEIAAREAAGGAP